MSYVHNPCNKMTFICIGASQQKSNTANWRCKGLGSRRRSNVIPARRPMATFLRFCHGLLFCGTMELTCVSLYSNDRSQLALRVQGVIIDYWRLEVYRTTYPSKKKCHRVYAVMSQWFKNLLYMNTANT